MKNPILYEKNCILHFTEIYNNLYILLNFLFYFIKKQKRSRDENI